LFAKCFNLKILQDIQLIRDKWTLINRHLGEPVEKNQENKVQIGKSVKLFKQVLGQKGDNGVLGRLDLVAHVFPVCILLDTVKHMVGNYGSDPKENCVISIEILNQKWCTHWGPSIFRRFNT